MSKSFQFKTINKDDDINDVQKNKPIMCLILDRAKEFKRYSHNDDMQIATVRY